jgi:membrane protein DedA with SNARE-associated domain
MSEWLQNYLSEATYVGIALVLFVAGLGVPIPEDIPLVFGGVMAGKGHINVYGHFALSMVFILIGDSCLFLIGRRLGSGAGSGLWGKLLTHERRAKAQTYFAKFGSWTVFFGRFLAGVRAAVFLGAGAAGFPYWRFIMLDALAAMISVPVWIWIGFQFGEHWEEILEQAKLIQGWLLGGLAFVVGLGWWWLRQRKAAKAQAVAAKALPVDVPAATTPNRE